jgi:hypothetical protein
VGRAGRDGIRAGVCSRAGVVVWAGRLRAQRGGGAIGDGGTAGRSVGALSCLLGLRRGQRVLEFNLEVQVSYTNRYFGRNGSSCGNIMPFWQTFVRFLGGSLTTTLETTLQRLDKRRSLVVLRAAASKYNDLFIFPIGLSVALLPLPSRSQQGR